MADVIATGQGLSDREIADRHRNSQHPKQNAATKPLADLLVNELFFPTKPLASASLTKPSWPSVLKIVCTTE